MNLQRPFGTPAIPETVLSHLVYTLAGVLSLPVVSAGTTGNEVAVVGLLDTSSSMGGEPIRQAITAASLFVAACDAQMDLELVTFDTRVTPMTGRLEPATAARREVLLARLTSTQAGGNTDLFGALELGLDLLRDSAGETKWLVLLTDGKANVRPSPALYGGSWPSAFELEPSDISERVGAAVGASAAEPGIRILVVGLGSQVDIDLLTTLATTTKGRFTSVDAPAALLPEFVDWLQTVGSFEVARSVDEVELVSGDSRFKVLVAPAAAGLGSWERDGQNASPRDLFDTVWSDEAQRLHVFQRRFPNPGRYRLRLDSGRSDDDLVYFLRHPESRIEVTFAQDSTSPRAPIRVVATAPGRVTNDSLDGIVSIDPLEGAAWNQEVSLHRSEDGSFLADLYVASDEGVPPAGAYNLSLELRDRAGGWESGGAQTVRFVERDPPHVTIEVLGPDATPLPRGVHRHVVLSPVVDRHDQLTLRVRGDAIESRHGLALAASDSDDVRVDAQLSASDPGAISISVFVPAQTAPGLRSFTFVFENPEVRSIDGDAAGFTVAVDVPNARLTLSADVPEPTRPVRRLGFGEWARLVLLQEPVDWRSEIPLRVTSRGLGAAAGPEFRDAKRDPQANEPADSDPREIGRSSERLTVTVDDEISATGDHGLFVEISCPYQSLEVLDAEGRAVTREGTTWRVPIATLNVRRPSLAPLTLTIGLIALLGVFYRPVPGSLAPVGGRGADDPGAFGPVRELRRRREDVEVGTAVVRLTTRGRSVRARCLQPADDGSAVEVECAAHVRVLRDGGPALRLFHLDVIRVGDLAQQYLAPTLGPHCSAADSSGLEDSVDDSEPPIRADEA